MPKPLNINSNIFKDKEQICTFKRFLPWHIFSSLCSCFKAERAVLTAMADI